MTDTFDVEAHSNCLTFMNSLTGMHATKEVQESLLTAVHEGKTMCKKFVALSIDISGSVYSPIPNLWSHERQNVLKCESWEIMKVISIQK